MAIRKNTAQPPGNILKRENLFDIILTQVKDGSVAAPTEEDCRQLREVLGESLSDHLPIVAEFSELV